MIMTVKEIVEEAERLEAVNDRPCWWTWKRMLEMTELLVITRNYENRDEDGIWQLVRRERLN